MFHPPKWPPIREFTVLWRFKAVQDVLHPPYLPTSHNKDRTIVVRYMFFWLKAIIMEVLIDFAKETLC